MKYLVYNRQNDNFTISKEKPELSKGPDCWVKINKDYSIRESDYEAYQAHKIATTNYCYMIIDGEKTYGHLIENDRHTIQRFTFCKGYELKMYERRRNSKDSHWEEWGLLQTVHLQ